MAKRLIDLIDGGTVISRVLNSQRFEDRVTLDQMAILKGTQKCVDLRWDWFRFHGRIHLVVLNNID